MSAERRGLVRATIALDRALQAAALALAISLLVACWHDVSQAYDVWYYHLPFAARLAGIVSADEFVFSADNQVRFEGYPLFGEMLQGALWRLTGHVQASNLVALASLFALVALLRRPFGVPLHLALLALLAIPLVHTHATAAYVDLPSNACVTMLLLVTWRALAAREAPGWRALAGCAALAAAAANMKFQIVPIVTIASLALLAASLRGVQRRMEPAARRALAKRLAVFLIAAPIVLATPIKNVALHGNPVWPVELRVAGVSLPHAEEAYDASPPHLATSPRPVRFLRSVLEIDNAPLASHARWSVDQWAPSDDPSCRMGGYFGAYVLVNLAALAVAAWRRRTRETWAAALLFGVVTVAASLVPQSHELRYYMHWMLLLVSLNLVLWARPTAEPRATASVGLVAAAALALVAWSTSGVYLYASGSTFPELLAKRVDRSILDAVFPGERLCIARQPHNLLYAPAFHPDKRYTVVEAASEAECEDGPRSTR